MKNQKFGWHAIFLVDHSVEIMEFYFHLKKFREIIIPSHLGPQCGKLLQNAITLKNFREINSSNLFRKNVDLTEKMLIFP